MKTWKQFIFVAVIAVFGIIGFISCDDSINYNLDGTTWIENVQYNPNSPAGSNGQGSTTIYFNNPNYTVIRTNFRGEVSQRNGSYSISGDTITLTNFYEPPTRPLLDPNGNSTFNSTTNGKISGNKLTIGGVRYSKQ